MAATLATWEGQFSGSDLTVIRVAILVMGFVTTLVLGTVQFKH